MPDIMTAYGPVFFLSRGTASPPIVAIHGAGGLGRYWGNQLVGLSRTTRFVAFDLPGHGRSTGPTHITIAEGAQRVAALMNALKMDQAVLLGHSMGSAIALSLARQQPARVRGLVLVGTGARLRVNPTILNGLQQDWHGTTRLITEWSYASGTSPLVLETATADLRQVDPQVVQSDYAACNTFDMTQEISAIDAPALVLVGEHDRMTPLPYTQQLAHSLPNATLQIIPNAGHMAMLEQPNAVNAAIREFMEGLEIEH